MSCPDCFSGGVHTGHPTGAAETIHGIPTYIAQPEAGTTPKGLIVMITDAFGWDFVNNRLLCDSYAKKGFLVYCPDFMLGSAMSPAALPIMHKIMAPASWFDTLFKKPILIVQAMILAIPWLIKTRTSITKPRVFTFFKALRTSPPPFRTDNLKIGAAGFCWGGAHTFALAHDTPSSRVHRHSSQINSSTLEPLIDCAFTAHPSNLVIPADIEAVKVPMSVAVGDQDMALKKEQVLQVKEILEVKMKGDHEVVMFEGAKHGFAVRTMPEDKLQLECADKAEGQAIAWFTRWFA